MLACLFVCCPVISGEHEAKVTANVALMDYAVGTINKYVQKKENVVLRVYLLALFSYISLYPLSALQNFSQTCHLNIIQVPRCIKSENAVQRFVKKYVLFLCAC